MSDRDCHRMETSSSGAVGAAAGEVDDGETDEDDDADEEPRLKIVVQDEDSCPAPAANGPAYGRVLHKSISYDGSGAVASSTRDRASEAVESLLLLCQEPVVKQNGKERTYSLCASPSGRRYSSSSDAFDTRSDPGSNTIDFTKDKEVVTYYQRMRERNNEASKRCRLKRRLKAETLESQAQMLHISNRLLRQRIAKIEKICLIMKEGVKHMQPRQCRCIETVANIKRAHAECDDSNCMTNKTLIHTSRTCRAQNPESMDSSNPSYDSNARSCSEDDEVMAWTSTSETSQVKAEILQIPGRSELSVTPLAPVQVALQPPMAQPQPSILPSVSISLARKPLPDPAMVIAGPASAPRTALDAINDTIVRSLSSPAAVLPGQQQHQLQLQQQVPSPAPLNLVKVVPAARPTLILPKTHTFALSSPSTSSSGSAGSPKQIIFLSSTPAVAVMRTTSTASTASYSSSVQTSSSEEEMVIQCEPEIQLVECDAASASVSTAGCCLASGKGPNTCSKELHNVNKLTAHRELLTRRVSRETGYTATERAIIKSSLKMPFWSEDEAVTYICERHRSQILEQPSLYNCALCGRKRVKDSSVQAALSTITYRMCLENHIKNGTILPIGQLVCGSCKEMHLKGIDISCSQTLPPLNDGDLPSPCASTMSIRTREQPCGSAAAAFAVVKREPMDHQVAAVSFNRAQLGPNDNISVVPADKIRIISPQTHYKNAQPQKIELTKLPPSSSLPPRVQINSASSAPAPTLAASASSLASPSSASTAEFTFASKLARLNEALVAINPRYKPTGFAVTSIEACSETALRDASEAAETAVATLLSVLAPGQESLLWSALKPRVDAKLGPLKKPSPPSTTTASN